MASGRYEQTRHMQLKAGGIMRRDFCTVEGPIYTNEIRRGQPEGIGRRAAAPHVENGYSVDLTRSDK